MLVLNKDYEELSEKLIDWIQKKIRTIGARGAVIGLSGGIDSSVTAVLCKQAFPGQTLGLIMPCGSNSEDEEDAKMLAEKFDIEYEVVNLNRTFATLTAELPQKEKRQSRLAVANIKPRLRMTVLYYFANLWDSLVVGTGNKSELELGYFTKYGDGGCDLLPLGNIVKTEVKEVAMALDLPRKILEKKPSAGLWEGQVDEEELGISYKEIDSYLLKGEARPRVKNIVEEYKRQNQHKLELPPVPDFSS